MRSLRLKRGRPALRRSTLTWCRRMAFSTTSSRRERQPRSATTWRGSTQPGMGAKLDHRRRATARIFATMEDIFMVLFDHDPGSRSRDSGRAYLLDILPDEKVASTGERAIHMSAACPRASARQISTRFDPRLALLDLTATLPGSLPGRARSPIGIIAANRYRGRANSFCGQVVTCSSCVVSL